MTELSFKSAPDMGQTYHVGDQVEVFCDHENVSGERVRDWLVGTVVQADPKMVAIQFRENVYLTDGWMVPDHVLWTPQDSTNIRFARRRRRRTKAKS